MLSHGPMCLCAASVEFDLTYVTCGSVIKLQHVATEHRLHSHQVNYGGGSGQQSVTGLPDGRLLCAIVHAREVVL
jgi:dolichyl-phosphate-mannose--protein O-mannosyl transferase